MLEFRSSGSLQKDSIDDNLVVPDFASMHFRRTRRRLRNPCLRQKAGLYKSLVAPQTRRVAKFAQIYALRVYIVTGLNVLERLMFAI